MGGKAKRRLPPASSLVRVPPRDLTRQWDRMTELLSLFVMTGQLAGARPASVVLIAEPGTGKTELLERFRTNLHLRYQSDMTLRGLLVVLREVNRRGVTHLCLTEFQKLFQRKASVADNCIGTMIQAMEEGISEHSIGSQVEHFGGARLGVLAAVTHGTMHRKREYLGEMGFLSRAAVIPWEPPASEVKDILHRINRGDDSDLNPVQLPVYQHPVEVAIPEDVGRLILDWTFARWKGDSLRPHNRFRALAQAVALKDARTRVTVADWAYVLRFSDYWNVMVTD